ncbi:MAG: DUF4403 family protein [Myxococcales bacterium]|nr:MAG: DUF4403 family protein [Myxococcales bacterium]
MTEQLKSAGRRAPVLGLAWLAFGGCASGMSAAPGDARSGIAECAVQLPSRAQAAARAPAGAAAAPESRVVVSAEAPLLPLQRALEERVPQRLAEGRVRIGPGGTVTYRVERGPLSLRVTSSALLIEAPARARAEACRGDDCYASCEPEARVVAEVPLMLTPDYRFRKTSVSATFTRACKVRALGGLLTVDVTPTLEAQLAPELAKVARQIDEQLPELKPRLNESWRELLAPRELPLGGCFVLQPRAIVQGPFEPSSTKLSGRFAVLARPELRARCEAEASFPPLPPLATDADLPREGAVLLGMVTPLESVARALEAAPPVEVSGKRVRVAHAAVTSRGSEADVELTLAGEVCGDLALRSAPSFTEERQQIELTRGALQPGESSRLAGSELDERELTQKLTAAVHLAPLLSVRGSKDAAPSLAASLSRPGFQVQALVSSTRAAGAAARGDELVAWLEARGAISLKLDTLR